MKKLFFSITIACIAIASIFILNFYSYCSTPYGSIPIDITINIPEGASFKKISLLLAEKNIIRKSIRFTLLAKLENAEQRIKTGEYCMTMPMSPIAVLDKLTKGEVIIHSVTIPEGKNIFDVAKIMEEAGLGSAAGTLQKMRDPEFIKSLGIKEESLEGFLFPDTYYFSRKTVPEKILRRMVTRHNRIINTKIKKASEKKGMTIKEVLILASLVEKETARVSEKPLIAAVFLNRLKKGMRLECDPTVIYGVKLDDPNFNTRLKTKHLRKETPYNTYRIFGLPKGPICNPGLGSIQAVLNPAETDYLYFVSKNNGAHQFSETLLEHNQAVYTYQKKK
jgi:UPF0755 protein